MRSCGCDCPDHGFLRGRSTPLRHPTDPPIDATLEDLWSIREQLKIIERLLERIFDREAYSRDPESLRTRIVAADIIDRHFDGIVEEWCHALDAIMGNAKSEQRREGLSNSLIRLIAHMRNPDDLTTYVYLRKHCQTGILAQAKPSEFNTIHIALKEIILRHVKGALHGARMQRVRDVVVAAIDERRLMVSQFYIESREMQLRASEEKYRNSINHAPDPMYEIEPHTWIVLGANSAAEKMHEMDPAHRTLPLIGRSIIDLEAPEARIESARHLEKVLATGADQTMDWPMGPMFFDVNSALISYGNKQFIQTILHDVTQRRTMMDSLLKAERLAATGTFAAGVAHEVNNPLAAISSLVQSLLSGEQDAQRRTTLHTILSQITRISGTLKDLVNFARPSTSHQKVIDINQLVGETLRVVTFDKRFRGTRIEPELAPDLKSAFADENEIQQVLLNILFNAADATASEGGLIRVITANKPAGPDGDRVERLVIKVIDNGIGIPRENLERVFDPFFTTKSAGAGVGLGLSLCQRIILANKGTIRVDSEVGKGTTVTIRLPAWEEIQEARGAAS